MTGWILELPSANVGNLPQIIGVLWNQGFHHLEIPLLPLPMILNRKKEMNKHGLYYSNGFKIFEFEKEELCISLDIVHILLRYLHINKITKLRNNSMKIKIFMASS